MLASNYIYRVKNNQPKNPPKHKLITPSIVINGLDIDNPNEIPYIPVMKNTNSKTLILIGLMCFNVLIYND